MASFSELPIYISLMLLPDISYLDVYSCQLVNKHWHEVFSSRDFSRSALHAYGPSSIENKALRKSASSSSLDATELFRTFCRRDRNLRMGGVSHQELRFVAKRAWTGRFLWGLSNNTLVYMSPEYREGLTCIVFDYEKANYRRGTMDLGPKGTLTVRSLKVFRNVVAAEHSTENAIENGERKSSYFLCEVQIFRISDQAQGYSGSVDGSSQVQCTRLSRFTTFQFRFVDYFESIISDLSETHYAALNLRYTGTRSLGLYVWQVDSGALVYHLPIDKTQIQHTLRSHCEGIVMFGDSKVMITSGDVRNKGKFKDEDEDGAAFKVYVRTLSIHEGDVDEEGVTVGRADTGVQNQVQILKSDRLVVGHGYNIHWRTVKHVTQEDVSASLNLWGRIAGYTEGTERKDHAQVLQYNLLPDNIEEGELNCSAIYSHISPRDATVNAAMEQSYSDQKLSGVPFYITSTGAMSYSMPFSGESIEVFGTRLIGYNFLARKFRIANESDSYERVYGGNGDPQWYILDFSSCLKSNEDKAKVRVIPSINRNVIGRGMSGDYRYGMEIAGDERMTIYSELKEENGMAALVANIWSPVEFSPAT